MEEFVAQWKLKKKPKLYCATLDIKKCYDSVNLKKLLEFFTEDTSILQNYFITTFFKYMKNKRFFFEREEDIKMQNFFVGKKREISNSIP